MRHRRAARWTRWAGLLTGLWSIVFASLVATSLAVAQSRESFALNRFQPAPTVEDGFALQLPQTLGHLRWSAQLMLDYSYAPLVLRQADGGPVVGDIVDHSLAAHAYAAVGLGKRWEIYAGLPVVLYQHGDEPLRSDGTSYAAPTVAGVGQPQVGGSVLAIGDNEKLAGFKLGLAASALIPIGSSGALTSDAGFGARGRLLASHGFLKGLLTPVLNLGVSYRPSRDYDDAKIGTELTFGAGLHVSLLQHALKLMAEVYGSTGLRSDQAFSRLATPLEALLASRYTFGGGVSLGGGVALGLTEAVGSPSLRALATVGYAPPRRQPAKPRKASPVRKDSDGDGVLDTDDACPQVAEDKDNFLDEDGCPDPDNDGDGIADVDDGCPEEPETHNRYQDDDGCPDTTLEVRIEEGQVTMPEPIEFQLGSAILLPDSFHALQQVADVLRTHPDIAVLSVEGHTSDEGSDAFNLDLSRRRARAVVQWLISAGIDASRLRARGYGKKRPVFANDTDEHRHFNRRVEFIIAEQRGP